MKRTWPLIGISILVAASVALGKGKDPKSGPLTGTWDCVAHSTAQADVPFTLKLEQTKEALTGALTNASGEYPLSSASYKKGVLEIHLDAPDGNYVATGKLAHGHLSGHWSRGEGAEGEWEGTKSPPPKQ